jgi:hypothetical protein
VKPLWLLSYAMRMPQNPVRWVLTILFLTLVGLTLWINWALKELEKRKEAVKKLPSPAATEQKL